MPFESLDYYQYFVKQNGTVVYQSNIFDAPYAALADFFEHAKEHFRNQKFKRTPSMNGQVIFVNEDEYEDVEGKKLRNELKAEFYQFQYKPMTCTHFADNILSLNSKS